MSDLQARRLDEIKDWRSAFRSFNIVSENVEPAMRQRDEMVEIIDDLLSFMDTPEASLNNRVIFQVGYNNYLLSEHVRVIDVAMLVRALDGAIELGWDDTLRADKEVTTVQIRIVPRESIKAPVADPTAGMDLTESNDPIPVCPQCGATIDLTGNYFTDAPGVTNREAFCNQEHCEQYRAKQLSEEL